MSQNAQNKTGTPAQKDWIAMNLQSLRETLARCGDLLDEQLPAHAALELHSLALNAGNFARFLGINALNSVRNGLAPGALPAVQVWQGGDVIHTDTAAS